MKTIVKDKRGLHVAYSHNLRAISRHAPKYGGVLRIKVHRTIATSGGAVVLVDYMNDGYTAQTVFDDHDHAVKWAFDKSSRPGTWFTGCDVYAPGAPLDDFTRAYLGAALWSSNHIDGERAGEPLDRDFDIYDICDDWRAKAVADCYAFQHANRADLAKMYKLRPGKPSAGYSAQGLAGHDFWLTRNRHGAGFWDRGMGKLGDKLTEIAQMWGTVEITEHDMKGSN